MTIQEIKKEKEARLDQLVNDCLVFFAFSNEQFTENKTPLQEGEKYVSIGAGGYMPKGKVQQWINGVKAIETWYNKSVKDTKGARRANIAYELANHEAYYTHSIADTLSALGAGYTAKEVWKVFNEEFKKHEAA